jgi:hypothetical protein
MIVLRTNNFIKHKVVRVILADLPECSVAEWKRTLFVLRSGETLVAADLFGMGASRNRIRSCTGF